MSSEDKREVLVGGLPQSNRLTYVLQFLTQQTPWKWQWTASEAHWTVGTDWTNSNLLTDGIGAKDYTTWFESKEYAISAENWTAIDPLAWIFYWLSRIEEYHQPSGAFDEHGRIKPEVLLPSAMRWWHKPMVDLTVAWLHEATAQKLQVEKPQIPEIAVHLTLDIDQTFVFKGKRMDRLIGQSARDLVHGRFTEFLARWATLLGVKKDPFDVFERVVHWAPNAQFFWLLADPGPFDRNLPWVNANQKKLIQTLAKKHSIGIHPSYHVGSGANEAEALLAKEKNRLMTLLQKPIDEARPHFLRFSLPSTLIAYESQGIKRFHGMGWAAEMGFRAGTAYDYVWYDVTRESTGKMWMCPFQAMDVTLKDYLHLQPEAAVQRLTELKASMMRTGGTLRLLWHNESLSGIYGWRNWETVPFRIMA